MTTPTSSSMTKIERLRKLQTDELAGVEGGWMMLSRVSLQYSPMNPGRLQPNDPIRLQPQDPNRL